MSKKSYKRNQNRLYREIKRRIIAEQKIQDRIKLIKCERKIETLKVNQIVPYHLEDHLEIIKQDMAKQIARHLIDNGYIIFNIHKYDYHLAEDEIVTNVKVIEAILDVVTPINI